MTTHRKAERAHPMERKSNSNIAFIKQYGALKAIALLMSSFLLGSCEAVGSIFQAGMNFGMFIVIAVIILIVVLVIRMGKNRTP